MSQRARARRRAALREEVRRFAALLGTRRASEATVHVGVFGGHRVSLDPSADWDHAQRADLLTRVIEGLPGPEKACCWITRAGHLTPTDSDQLWMAAAREAFQRHGLDPTERCFVLTRRAWVNLHSGEAREWRRMRPLATVTTSTTAPEDQSQV